MSLSWKDAVATVLVGAAGLVTYARVKGFEWPFLGSWRSATLVVLALGLGTCIVVGSGVTPTKDGWTTAATVLGALAFVFALVGMIAGNKYAFMALAADIAVLWVVTTLHHLTT